MSWMGELHPQAPQSGLAPDHSLTLIESALQQVIVRLGATPRVPFRISMSAKWVMVWLRWGSSPASIPAGEFAGSLAH